MIFTAIFTYICNLSYMYVNDQLHGVIILKPNIAMNTRNAILSFFAGASLLVSASAQDAAGKMNFAGQVLFEQYQSAQQSRSKGESPRRDVPESMLAIVELADGYDAVWIDGVEVLDLRGGMAIISVPTADLMRVAGDESIRRMSVGGRARLALDKARTASRASRVMNGTSYSLPKNYNGTGVVLGMMDQGFDPNHINFLNADQSASRVSRVWVYGNTEGAAPTVYDTPTAIASLSTDNTRSTHATHVAGIMGGAYNKNCDMVKLYNGQPMTVNAANTYYGLARGAEYAVGVGTLYDANIMDAAQKVLDYARSQGRPAVFNLSLGSVLGPHDGTDVVDRYLAELGKDMIIVMAAGNDGMFDVSLRADFSAGAGKVSTLPVTDDNTSWGGFVQVWSDTSDPVKVVFSILNVNTGAVTYSYEIGAGQESITVGGSGTSVTSSQFSEAFSSDSYIVVESGVESGNNRYLASLYLDLTAKNLRNPDFVPMLTIEGAAGQGASAYISSDNDDLLTFGNRGLAGYVSGSPAQSVSSMACGENVIVVGSYNSRNTFPVLKGALMGFNDQAYPVDGVSSFTSYGTTFAGKKLPELCAPGMTVISSVSTPWVKGTAQDVGVFSAKVDRSGLSGAMKAARTDYWEQMQGTSMATPYVSGVVALLLEQDPTLTVDRVRDLLVSTAQAMPADTEPVALKWGAGKLDAENAMRKLLGMPSSIGEVTADTERRFSMEQSDGFITAGIAGESGVRATLTSIAGLAAATAKGSGDVVEIATSGLAPGVYVLTVEGDSGSVISRKVIVK